MEPEELKESQKEERRRYDWPSSSVVLLLIVIFMVAIVVVTTSLCVFIPAVDYELEIRQTYSCIISPYNGSGGPEIGMLVWQLETVRIVAI